MFMGIVISFLFICGSSHLACLPFAIRLHFTLVIFIAITASSVYLGTLWFKPQEDLYFIVAALHEGFRHARSGSFNVPHMSTRDFTLGGFFIPKDTQVFVNFGAIRRSSDYFEVRSVFLLFFKVL